MASLHSLCRWGMYALSLLLLLWEQATAAEWEVGGELKTRFEQIDGRFRAGRSGEDHILVTMANLKIENSAEGFGAVFEFQDSRAFLNEPDTPLGTGIVNSAEPIQLALQYRSGERLLRGGRITMDMGSRRLVARNIFRNTTETFDGFEYRNRFGQQRVQAFAVLPVTRLVGDRTGQERNEFELDHSSQDHRFVGALWGYEGLAPGLDLELYALHLSDDRDSAGSGLRFFTPGLRLRWLRDNFDVEFEGALQHGRLDDGSGGSLDQRAGFIHAEFGWTQDKIGRLALELDWSSGDSDPNDDRNGTFDDLFSAVVGDKGPTGILGLLRRANLRAATLRHEWRFADGLYLRSALRRVYLDQSRDQWYRSGIRDISGNSGRDLGWFFDSRLRITTFEGWQSDIGINWVEKSDLARGIIPGMSAMRSDDRTRFAYVEIARRF